MALPRVQPVPPAGEFDSMGGVGDAGSEVAHRQEGGQDAAAAVVVGFAFMAKKMQSMAEVMNGRPIDGVEFHPLDFSQRPDQHRRVDVILHKLSEDIMFRDARPEGSARMLWIEAYLSEHPDTVILDPLDRVAKCINRITTLEVLEEAYRRHGAEGGMPRPPRFVVLEKHESANPGTPGVVPRNDLAFPVICKSVEACGTRGSHAMVVVLDEAGMLALTPPIVVQECRNHGAKIFKVCVVGDEVRVHERPSLPDLPQGLVGSFSFDSQKPYPTLDEVQAASAAASMAQTSAGPPQPPRNNKPHTHRARGDCCDPSSPPSSTENQGTGDEDGVLQRRQTSSRLSSSSSSSSSVTAVAVAIAAEVEATAVASKAAAAVAEASDGPAAVASKVESPPPPGQAAAGAARAGAEVGASVAPAAAAAAPPAPTAAAGASRGAAAPTAPPASGARKAAMELKSPPPSGAPSAAAAAAAAAASPPSAVAKQASAAPVSTTTEALTEHLSPPGSPPPAVTLEAARTAAARMKEAFGLSLFGFDLIIDGTTGEALVIDVNYFPSFKDLKDFPRLLRLLLLRQVAASPRKE
ncbi:unnamed protein product [Pylaiella littoralis]